MISYIFYIGQFIPHAYPIFCFNMKMSCLGCPASRTSYGIASSDRHVPPLPLWDDFARYPIPYRMTDVQEDANHNHSCLPHVHIPSFVVSTSESPAIAPWISTKSFRVNMPACYKKGLLPVTRGW